ncbi:4Fe-4S dicluster domain-containing protein [Faecalicatena contorta]|uniref:Ferredoxin n=1 Tax=Faecalicatena contorta TaxID=39482 RepID=A0A315ZY53_9FIRM|nr:4Fe-4S binding protein [Faecalicatena contorta]PWJ50606.1 dissimilatory adenylylsulfate reductase beta subunit [Faecalicatena contorta]SUQ14014.1 dissimilatory adenylylsulfate reductase beta subunit [Faecalicatena contorta]
MSIEIKTKQCIGCGRCCKVCPGSLICLNGGIAEIPHPERCWGCVSCVKECPVQAIQMYLGEDMGGLGGRLHVLREDTLLHWTVRKPDGSIRTLTVDSRDSNKY